MKYARRVLSDLLAHLYECPAKRHTPLEHLSKALKSSGQAPKSFEHNAHVVQISIRVCPCGWPGWLSLSTIEEEPCV
jgi:hypothetical protein